jgi:hypothetical protein
VWEFDRVFGGDASQASVFEEVRPMAAAVLDGVAACVFAYGATGSGKTHSMIGPVSARGCNYRLLTELMRLAAEREASHAHAVRVSLVEVYNDTLVDLLADETPKRRLRLPDDTEDTGAMAEPDGAAVGEVVGERSESTVTAGAAAAERACHVPGCFTYPVHSVEDVVDVMTIGDCFRTVDATLFNARSSRSHTVLSVSVAATCRANGDVVIGRLHLVDLAGSEYALAGQGHAHPSQPNGAGADNVKGQPAGMSTAAAASARELAARLQAPPGGRTSLCEETRHIHASLVALADVVSALRSASAAERGAGNSMAGGHHASASPSHHPTAVVGGAAESGHEGGSSPVPYGASTLTRLLRPALSLESRIAMLCCVDPGEARAAEALAVLQFVAEVKDVRTSGRSMRVGGRGERATAFY